ncbi:T9SS type A sorting domain-containing protein [Lentimicrobium sp. L6]|uniref:choice-of-anchor V domain-containing protein n=1 Tax=Lentimicrobium sp. L6 TaxID=2735916 RepID=UPI0015573D07|nr:choice-of-anchor V domain-containing protein [Lentimicrobium sp. L6]NPD83538.1 T9SS type A sorting domain-containing protein [Lentimicrobium sp. L6]
MKNKYSFFIALLAPTAMALFFAGTLFHGGSPGGKSGSPGDNGATCTQCHAGTATQQDGMISTNIPELGYVTGETYEVMLSATDADAGRFGFELTAEDADGNKVGQFIISADGQTQLANGNKAITHTASGITPVGDSKEWAFTWTAPSTDVGIITFYSAVNAANNNGGTSGDQVLTSNVSYDESTIGIGEEPLEAFFNMSPNPSFGSIKISHEYNDAKLSIIDISGKIVFQEEYYQSDAQIDLSNLNKGVFLVQLQSKNQVKTMKLMIK